MRFFIYFMARIIGISIPDNKQIEIALTYIFGIGRVSSRKILKGVGINPNLRISKLSPEELNKIKKVIEQNYKVGDELKREIMMNIKRLKDIKSWRGIRHLKHLPVRGQRTRTNTRTVRGNVRRTVGSGRKKAPAPK